MIILCVALVDPVLASPSDLIIEGLAVRERHPESLGWNENRGFTVFKAGGSWRIRLAGRAGREDHTDIFLDGDRTFYMSMYASVLEEWRAQGREVGENVATAMIRPDRVPFFPTAELVGPIWATFLSGEFFANQRDGKMSPLVSAGIMASRAGAAEEITTQRFSRAELVTALAVPNRIDYLFEGTVTDSGRQEGYQMVQSMFGGQTNAVFEIVATTNVAGLELPQESLFTVLVPANAPGISDAHWFSYRVLVTNLHLTAQAAPVIRPDMPGLTLVSDFRFVRPDEPLLFSYRTSHWLTDAEVRRLPEYSRAMASVARRPQNPMIGLLFAFVVVVTTTPLLWLLYRRNQTRASTK